MSETENLWLKSLTDNLGREEDVKRLVEDYLKNTENNLYQEVLETIMRANERIFEPSNGLEDIMLKLYQEKIQEKIQEGIQEGIDRKLKEEAEKAKKKAEINRISLVWKKCVKNKPLPVIADEMETDTEDIRPIYNAIIQNPGKTVEEIYELTVGKKAVC